jgi:RNA polymerase sigma factor (sigma-70 family)
MILGTADRLLARLNQGDAEAAAQLFQSFEPYLRIVIRRKISHALRAKFDSTDIVQSVWADVVSGLHQSRWTFQSIDQLRAFLLKMTRNRLIDRVRQNRRALEHELPMPAHDIEMLAAIGPDRASDNLDADELWRQMLDACPPAHCRVLYLKRQGASLDEIAALTGLHKGSVRRILYQIGRHVTRLRATQN